MQMRESIRFWSSKSIRSRKIKTISWWWYGLIIRYLIYVEIRVEFEAIWYVCMDPLFCCCWKCNEIAVPKITRRTKHWCLHNMNATLTAVNLWLWITMRSLFSAESPRVNISEWKWISFLLICCIGKKQKCNLWTTKSSPKIISSIILVIY